ncbi:hypothetical protein GALL_548670 [mine drainage metagenome]|uniref:Uncharacterized protein n=1 Tax=mine drainage metagenome TaxID=410659 RepID=A0A1J5NZC1_9ZZZZ
MFQYRQFSKREARTVCHPLAQCQFREAPQFFDRDGGRLDDVTQLRVMFDLQAGNPKPLGEIQLQLRDHLPAFVTQGAMSVQLAVETRPDRPAIVQPCRHRIGQRPAEIPGQSQPQRNGCSGVCQGRGQRPGHYGGNLKCRIQPDPYRRQIARRTAVQ